MKFEILISLLVILARCETSQEDIKNFATGLLLSIRFAEKVPSAFGCYGEKEWIQFPYFVKLEELLGSEPQISAIIDGIRMFGRDDIVITGECANTDSEIEAYFKEVRQVINDVNFIFQIGKYLLQYRDTVTADITESMAAKTSNDHFTAGIYIGDIFRIAIWGEPNPQ